MSPLKRALLSTLPQLNSLPHHWRTYLLPACILTILIVGFHQDIANFISAFFESYLQAQQALVDAQFFAC